MNTTLIMQIGTEEICRLSDISTTTIVEIVEHGIIQPIEDTGHSQEPFTWRFDPGVVSITKKAVRLHRDLDIDWAGIALAIDLLQDLEKLRNENQQLKQQLNRFLRV